MYACTASTQDGARCRHWADGDTGLCPACSRRKRDGEEIRTVSIPDVVLYKFNLNKTWSERLKALGVSVKQYDVQAKEAKHVAHAEKFGRGAYVIRKDVADSGVPVFGKDGLQSVSLFETLKDLLAAYEVVDIHIRPRRDGDRFIEVLVVNFSHQGNAIRNEAAMDEILRFLSASCWGYCHVWANPPQDDGRVVNTVNSSHREESGRARLVLRFVNGLWATE